MYSWATIQALTVTAKMNSLEVKVKNSVEAVHHYHNFEITSSNGKLGKNLCHKAPYDDAFSIRRGGVSAICNGCHTLFFYEDQ